MIVFLSLSTADQRIWLLPEFRRGTVNRTREVLQCVGGKAINAARTATLLGAAVKVFCVASRPLTVLLREEGMDVEAVATDEPARRATSVVDLAGREVSELVEEARPLAQHHLDHLVEKFLPAARKAAVVCVCGSLPQGVSSSFYATLLGELRDSVTVLDTHGEPLAHALRESPFMVKPNRLELENLLGKKAASLYEVALLSRELLNRGARYAAVSCGAEGLILVGDGEVVRFTPPHVEPVNSTGCGDAVTGGVACGLASGLNVRESVGLGVGCAAASALTPIPGAFTPGMERDLAPAVEVIA